MEFLGRDCSLHGLSTSGSSEKWAQILEVAQNDEHAYMMKIQVNRRNQLRYTPLHTAIFSRNIVALKALTALGADVDLKCYGTPLLHLVLGISALPEGQDFGTKAFFHLLPLVDVSMKDEQGSSVLHIAADLNLAAAIATFMEHEAAAGYLDSRDRAGVGPLHRAAAANSAEAVTALMAAGALPNSQSSTGSTPLHSAALSGAARAWSALIKGGADANILDMRSRSALETAKGQGWTSTPEGGLEYALSVSARSEQRTKRSVTAVLTHPMCVRHFTCPPSSTTSPSAPPENIRRLTVLLDELNGCLRSSDLAEDLTWVEETRAAALSDVLRVHEWPYIKQIQNKCETIGTDPEGQGGIGSLDGDTTLSHGSFAAAMHAAGSVCEAVDMVVTEKVVNAFCAVRPPGHHAGPRGLVKGDDGGPDSHGFCFLNNISIGAAYALNVHREHVKRVAIVDFDVHHGNGTEETIRWLSPSLETSEVVTPMGFGTLSAPRYKPWHDVNDAENVLFVSVHGYGPREEGQEHLMPHCAFYPGSGKTTLPTVLPPRDHKNPYVDVGVVSDSTTSIPTSISPSQRSANSARRTSQKAGGAANGNENGHAGGGGEGEGHSGDDSEENEDNDAEGDGEGQGEEGEEEGEGEGDDEDKVGSGSDEDDDQGGEGEGEGGPEGEGEGDEEDSDSDDGDYGPSSTSSTQGLRKGSGKVAALHSLFRTKGASKSIPLIVDIGVCLPSAAAESGQAPVCSASEYRHRWRNSFRDEIFPRLMTFKPDMIFISAGFDAHKKDAINSGYIALVEEDFEWVTTNLLRISNSCSKGRVVSALEGGYQIGGEFSSAFAKSVKAHVAALIRGGKAVRAPYVQEDAEREKEIERELLEQAEITRLERMEAQRALKARQEALRREEEEREDREESERMKMDEDVDESADSAEGDKNGTLPLGAKEEDANEELETNSVAAADSQDDTANSGRKRRRAAVDYVALNLELQKSKDAV